MNRDAILRGAVTVAFDAKDSDAYSGACADVVRVWTVFPYLEATPAIEAAERELAAHRARIADALQALKDSYPTEAACAA